MRQKMPNSHCLNLSLHAILAYAGGVNVVFLSGPLQPYVLQANAQQDAHAPNLHRDSILARGPDSDSS